MGLHWGQNIDKNRSPSRIFSLLDFDGFVYQINERMNSISKASITAVSSFIALKWNLNEENWALKSLTKIAKICQINQVIRDIFHFLCGFRHQNHEVSVVLRPTACSTDSDVDSSSFFQTTSHSTDCALIVSQFSLQNAIIFSRCDWFVCVRGCTKS